MEIIKFIKNFKDQFINTSITIQFEILELLK